MSLNWTNVGKWQEWPELQPPKSQSKALWEKGLPGERPIRGEAGEAGEAEVYSNIISQAKKKKKRGLVATAT
jgi:hypothetical protein